MTSLSRREFTGSAAAAAAGAVLAPAWARAADAPVKNPLPRWRGFNLLNFFQALDKGERGQGDVSEDDLRWIRDWGFDFIRLPMDYWLWVDSDWPQTRTLKPDDVCKIKEPMMAKVDRAVELCRKYGLHCNLNFHRAPGYCINNPAREPYVLWSDTRAEDAFAFHWDLFAKRYRGVPAKDLSFNLVNEAPGKKAGYMSGEDYRRVMTRGLEAVRKHSADRVVIIDGYGAGSEIVKEMISSGVAQSVHTYWPGTISHYRASWVDKDGKFPEPAWPELNKDGSHKNGRPEMEKKYAPWGELVRQGVGVHCGECGCFNRTPTKVFLAWFTDMLEVIGQYGIGWSLWEFRGAFGILDSGRADVSYEDWQGHTLDRQLLDLLRRH
jgi:aryl-phospho-beta-D-glucosidase BglC (GH1 family)